MLRFVCAGTSDLCVSLWGFMSELKCLGALGWKTGRKGFKSCGAGGSEVPGAAPAGRGRFRVGDVVHLVQERHHLRPLGTRPLRQDLLHDPATGEPGMRWRGFESTRGGLASVEGVFGDVLE